MRAVVPCNIDDDPGCNGGRGTQAQYRSRPQEANALATKEQGANERQQQAGAI